MDIMLFIFTFLSIFILLRHTIMGFVSPSYLLSSNGKISAIAILCLCLLWILFANIGFNSKINSGKDSVNIKGSGNTVIREVAPSLPDGLFSNRLEIIGTFTTSFAPSKALTTFHLFNVMPNSLTGFDYSIPSNYVCNSGDILIIANDELCILRNGEGKTVIGHKTETKLEK